MIMKYFALQFIILLILFLNFIKYNVHHYYLIYYIPPQIRIKCNPDTYAAKITPKTQKLTPPMNMMIKEVLSLINKSLDKYGSIV